MGFPFRQAHGNTMQGDMFFCSRTARGEGRDDLWDGATRGWGDLWDGGTRGWGDLWSRAPTPRLALRHEVVQRFCEVGDHVRGGITNLLR